MCKFFRILSLQELLCQNVGSPSNSQKKNTSSEQSRPKRSPFCCAKTVFGDDQLTNSEGTLRVFFWFCGRFSHLKYTLMKKRVFFVDFFFG